MIQTSIFDILEDTNKPQITDDTYLGPKSTFVGYSGYIKSNDWRKKRKYALEILGHRCQRCGKEDTPLQVHHKHYKSLYHERLEDVNIFCVPCHKKTHIKIEEQREKEAYGNAYDTWVIKRYRADAHDYMDADLLSEEFNEWLDRKALQDL